MSGDVQPRKRKDKKRKKDESTEQIPPQTLLPPVSNPTEDVNIHVHKDDGTGGGICAKIIFFLLFSALVLLIGLIITEHRGLTDLDTADQESRFSQLFEGWTDSSVGHDDDSEHIVSALEDEDHDDHDDHEDNESQELEEDDEVVQSEEQDERDEEASDEVPQTEEEEDEEEDEDEEEPNIDNVDSEEQEHDDETELRDNEDDESEEADDGDQDQAASEEEPAQNGDDNEDAQTENEDTPQEAADEEREDDDNQDAQQNSKMVVKIGVGVALLVVAHVVLVRKWKSANATGRPDNAQPIPDLNRRNTIVVPPTFQEVKQDIEEVVDEEEYSDEDGEVDSDDGKTHVKSAKLKYQELRTTYTRSLTPESEPEIENKPEEADDEEYEEEEDDEELDEEEEEDSEIGEDDEELLRRLEAKYGKLKAGAQRAAKDDDFDEQFSSWKRVNVRDDNEAEESESDKQSDDAYEYDNLTNKDDYRIKEQIDDAQKNIQNNTAYAIKLFDALLQNYSSSPRSLYGMALALDVLAEEKRSNAILQQAIKTYLQVLDLSDVPNALFIAAAERCINRMRFLGNYNRAFDVHNKLIGRFPEAIKYRNDLVVSYLSSNRPNYARNILKETLAKYPDDGFALVHYGFVLKTVDNNLEESVSYLSRGIATKQPGVVDGRFYFHLGDALTRLGKMKEALEVYEDGVKHKLFLSKYQRSLYNVDRLKSRPWWVKSETPYSSLYAALEQNWEKIRDEGLSVLSETGGFQSESENLKDRGDWKQFELFARGHKNVNNCKKCPITCRIIESVPDAKGCKRGQTKFSVIHPGTHVWPHCGPTNCRLRVHLGLKVPENTYIRIADEIRSWKDGKVLIFDDSFEHEVWHNGTTLRLVLIVDVWHPDLTPLEKQTLPPI